MRSDADAKRQIIEIVNDLFAAGHLTPTGGNVSARAADDDKIWITPSQLYKGGLTAVKLQDCKVLCRGRALLPSCGPKGCSATWMVAI